MSSMLSVVMKSVVASFLNVEQNQAAIISQLDILQKSRNED